MPGLVRLNEPMDLTILIQDHPASSNKPTAAILHFLLNAPHIKIVNKVFLAKEIGFGESVDILKWSVNFKSVICI